MSFCSFCILGFGVESLSLPALLAPISIFKPILAGHHVNWLECGCLDGLLLGFGNRSLLVMDGDM